MKLTLALAAGTIALAACAPQVDAIHAPAAKVVGYNRTQVDRQIPLADGQRLDVMFTATRIPTRWARHWGSDSSLAWAHETCLDFGGEPHWRDGEVLRCWNVDT